jgi:hypothetical protein
MMLELERMSIRQKLQVMEELWGDLSTFYNEREILPRHKEILLERKEKLENGEEEWLEWNEVRRELADR